VIRKTNFQSLAWLHDIYKRKLLELDPPYQRRSVWNQSFKDFFVDTVLNNYPCPAIFLYEQITPEGAASYKVVDGKQRLLTLFEFVNGDFPVSQEASLAALRDRNFGSLTDEQKLAVWRYQFAVEFIPSEDERLINEIFDRINRNVARLTRQELRHAKYGGLFTTEVERLTDWMFDKLPKNFPLIATQSRVQMKDSEFVGNLLLLIEEGPKSYSQDALDDAYSERDETWISMARVVEDFTLCISFISDILTSRDDLQLQRTRFRNQADFYSLVGAIHDVRGRGLLPIATETACRLSKFITFVDSDEARRKFPPADSYYAAARSASNDPGPRLTRINTIAQVITAPAFMPNSHDSSRGASQDLDRVGASTEPPSQKCSGLTRCAV
jgi:hypothetical protein